MKQLASNSELYTYLLQLAEILDARGSGHSSRAVLKAAQQATGFSTEFLGESRIALRRVATVDNKLLSNQEGEMLLDVIKQLDAALERRS